MSFRQKEAQYRSNEHEDANENGGHWLEDLSQINDVRVEKAEGVTDYVNVGKCSSPNTGRNDLGGILCLGVVGHNGTVTSQTNHDRKHNNVLAMIDKSYQKAGDNS